MSARSIECSDCGRRFGGVTGHDRHLSRRDGWRCRSDAALRRRGLVLTDGVWHVRVVGQRVIPSLGRTGGSQSVEDRGQAVKPTRATNVSESVRAKQKNGGPAS